MRINLPLYNCYHQSLYSVTANFHISGIIICRVRRISMKAACAIDVSRTRFRKSIDRARVPIFQRAPGSNSKELIGQPSSSSASSPANRQPPMLLAVCHPPRTHLVAVYVRRSHRNTVLSFGRISLKLLNKLKREQKIQRRSCFRI